MTTTNTASIEGATVSTYTLAFRNVRNPALGHSKIATMVTLTNGQVIRFVERTSKRDALRSAARQIGRRAAA
jgi:hypothetical protein